MVSRWKSARRNFWYKAHTPSDLRKPGWPEAPGLIEEVYNFEDALIVGGVLITLMNNADRVKAACLAQLVNVIGAIMTESGGPAWRQTIFHPFSQASKFGHGNVLRTRIETDSCATATHPQLDYLLATVLHDTRTGRATVFALNCHTTEEMNLAVEMRGLGERKIVSASELHHGDIKAANTRSAPSTVTPSEHRGCSLAEGHLKAKLRPPIAVNRASPTNRLS